MVRMGKKKSKLDKYCLTHITFFEAVFQMPSLGIAFLKKTLPGKLRKYLDLERLTIEKVKFYDTLFRKTRPDIVYKVPIIGADEYASIHVIIEHKSFDDHSAIYQIWQYIAQLCIQDVKNRLTDLKTKKRKPWPKNFRLSPIIPIILYHGGKPFTGETQLVNLFYPLPGAEKYLPHLQAILFDLSAIDDDKLPRDPNAPELHVVLLIMKVIFSKSKITLKNKLGTILEELQPYSQNPKYRELIRKLWYYVLYNSDRLTEIDYHELETRIQETIGENSMPTLAQIFLDRGREQGAIKREAKAILRTLTKRFKAVPKPLEGQVHAIADLERLEQLADFAYDCKSLEEFAESVS